MKSIFTYALIIFSVLLLSMKSDNSRKYLLCHKWIQFAFKNDMASLIKPVDRSMAKEITFNSDNSYKEALYNNQFITTGNYFLNDDSTKMEFTILTINGKSYPPFPEQSHHYNNIIIKLNADTLIYGSEFYKGNNVNTMNYDHSDSYFVREN